MANTRQDSGVIGEQADQVPENTGKYPEIGQDQAKGSAEAAPRRITRPQSPVEPATSGSKAAGMISQLQARNAAKAAPKNLAAQVSPAATAVPRLTREQKREANRLLKQQIELQEIAGHNKPPPNLTLRIDQDGGSKQITAVPHHLKGQPSNNPAGRPSEYTEAEAVAICSWISSGKSLNKYCQATGRDHTTVYQWLRERPLFSTMYSQAHEDRADTLVDEMVEIADDSQHAQSMEEVTAARLRVDTRKWIASKMRQSKYGDKVEVKQTGSVSIRLGIGKAAAAPVTLVEEVTPKLPG